MAGRQGRTPSLMKMSAAFKEATYAHLRGYAAQTLDELAVETGAPEVYLTPEVRLAFKNLKHKIVSPLPCNAAQMFQAT